MSDRPIISRSADYQDRFARVHSGTAPEPSEPPLRSWAPDLASGAGLLLFMIAGFICMDRLAAILCWVGWSPCL